MNIPILVSSLECTTIRDLNVCTKCNKRFTNYVKRSYKIIGYCIYCANTTYTYTLKCENCKKGSNCWSREKMGWCKACASREKFKDNLNKDSRLCYSCGEKSYTRGSCYDWRLNLPTNYVLCVKCYIHYYPTPPKKRIQPGNKRRVRFNGKQLRLPHNPRTGICNICRAIEGIDCSGTHIHCYSENPLLYMEYCNNCCNICYIFKEEVIQIMRMKRLNQVIPKRDSNPELILQGKLRELGIEFDTHIPIYGQPDIFIAPNICIFVDGDYWHGNPKFYDMNSKLCGGKSAQQIWDKDKNITHTLEEMGMKVIRIWESDIIENIEKIIRDAFESMWLHSNKVPKYAFEDK